MAARDSRSEWLARRSLFRDLDPFRDFFDRPLWMARLMDQPLPTAAARVGWAPAMDVAETREGYRVTMELPGVSRDDISVECNEHVLIIRGEKKSERTEQDEHRHYAERSYGSFTRSLRLPADADEDVKATFRDGVLTVEIPRATERRRRVVEIES